MRMTAGKGGRVGWGVPLLVVAAPALVLAHGDEVRSLNAPRAFSPWDLGVLLLLVVVGTLYLLGAVRLARRAHFASRALPASPAPPARLIHWEPFAFAVGWGALVLSILPPLDSLSIQFFSVHMIQHELMMLVGAPLVIFGRPFPRCVAGLPGAFRHRAARALQSQTMSSAWRVLTAPLLAWALH